MKNEKKFHKFCKRAGAVILSGALVFTTISANDFTAAANNTEVIEGIDFTDSLAEENEGQAEVTTVEPTGEETAETEESVSEPVQTETETSEPSTEESTESGTQEPSSEITETEISSVEESTTEEIKTEEISTEEITTEESTTEELTTEETETEESTTEEVQLLELGEEQEYEVIFLDSITKATIKTEKIPSVDDLDKVTYPDLENEKIEKDGTTYGFAKWLDPVTSEKKKTITITAKFGRVYTIKFDLNGGQGTVPAEISAVEGRQYELPGKDGLTKEGCFMDGWATAKNTDQQQGFIKMVGYKYPLDDQIDAPQKNTIVTLYANWVKQEKRSVEVRFFIRYSDNTVPNPYKSYSTALYTGRVATLWQKVDSLGYVYDPSGDNIRAKFQNFPNEDSIKASLNKAGWKDSQGRSYESSLHQICWYVFKHEKDGYHIDGIVQEKKRETEKVHLWYYANIKSEIIDKYQLDVDEEKVKVQDMPDEQITDKGKDFTLSSKRPAICIDNVKYTFKGWYLEPECSNSIEDSENQKILKNVQKDIKLYAKWERDPECEVTLTYLKNCDEDVSDIPESEKCVKNGKLKVSNKVPVRAGYTFIGWNTQADGKGSDFKADQDIEMPDDRVLYAQWEQIKYKVTYLNEDGTEVIPTASYALGKEVIKPEDSKVPEKKPTEDCYYEFAGWKFVESNELKSSELYKNYVSYAAEGTRYAALDAYDTCQGNAVYIAQFKEIKKVTLTYLKNCEEKEVVNNIPKSEKCIKNGKLKVSNKVPVRAGYTFMGWNTQADGKGSDFKADQDIEMPNDRVLYAQWEQIKYKVTYLNEDGTEVIPTASYALGKEVIKPEDSKVPEKKPTEDCYYEFAGWKFVESNELKSSELYKNYVSYAADGTKYAALDANDTCQGNAVYVATFKEKNKFIVRYIDDDNVKVFSDRKYMPNEENIVPSDPEDKIKDGKTYKFTGWEFVSDGWKMIEGSSEKDYKAVSDDNKCVGNAVYRAQYKAPDPKPTPDPDPTPDPEPDPDPTPDPNPTPSPDPTPDPDPTPSPEPTPITTTITDPFTPLAASPLALTTIMDEGTPLADTVTILDEDTPLADTVTILDEDTPLASMPDTGDHSANPMPFALAGVAALVAAFAVRRRTRQSE